MMRISSLRPRSSKKRLFIIGGIIFVVALSMYTLWSKQVWAELTPASTQWYQSIKTDIEKVVALPTANEKDREMVIAKLSAISQRIDAHSGEACKVNAMVRWQRQFIASLREELATCEGRIARVVSFRQNINSILAYLKDDQALAKIISSVPQVGEVADDTWSKQADAWDRASKAVAQLAVVSSFKSTQQLALKKTEGIKVAWQEVVAAHQAKDKQRYIAAQKALAASIDALSEVSTHSRQSFVQVANGLEKATQQLFI